MGTRTQDNHTLELEESSVDKMTSTSELGLCLCWSRTQKDRIGEVARVVRSEEVLGRGTTEATLAFRQERPDGAYPALPLTGHHLSRRQLEIVRRGDSLEVRNRGGAELAVNGTQVDDAVVSKGDILEIRRLLVMLVVGRDLVASGPVEHAFGTPDAYGIVGESPTIWRLRGQLGFAARVEQPVLLTGPSGAGKELAAQAIHRLSNRHEGPFIARNAATIPETLVDAEVFGTAANYPNSGQPARPGLIGAADGGTLFLDEVGEMQSTTQAHLLRVLDAKGVYHRLGDATERHSDFRFLAATNRDIHELKHDFAARLTMNVSVPGLDARRQDIPLIARRLLEDLRRFADPDAAYLSSSGEIRISSRLMVALLRHAWTGHVRELRSLLLTAMGSCAGRSLTLTSEVEERMEWCTTLDEPQRISARELDAETIRAALEKCEGNVSRAARELGLSSRYVLYRQMKRLGISV